MAEANTVVEPVAPVVSKVTQAFLDKFGFSDLAQAETVFADYKGDIAKLKGDNRTLTAEQSELNTLKAEAEERRTAELSENELLKENLGTKDESIAGLTSQLEAMKKSGVKDKVLFLHSANKTLMGTRMKLYETAAKAQEWTTAEELNAVFTKVDTDFDAELKSMNINLPAPGDGSGGGSTGDTKYDQKFFENFGK